MRHRLVPRLCAAGAAAALLAGAGSAAAAVHWFKSPTGNLSCEVADHDSRGSYAYCQSERKPVSAKLRLSGVVKVCTGETCLGNGPEGTPVLAYGHAVTVGRFRCTSRADGIRCRVKATGRGYLINGSGVTRLH
ncbi:MAG: DUF6636 domain-containing protein [Thermoleophilia bacterium]